MDSPTKGKRRSKAQHQGEKPGDDKGDNSAILDELAEFLKPLPACISPIMDMVTIVFKGQINDVGVHTLILHGFPVAF